MKYKVLTPYTSCKSGAVHMPGEVVEIADEYSMQMLRDGFIERLQAALTPAPEPIPVDVIDVVEVKPSTPPRDARGHFLPSKPKTEPVKRGPGRPKSSTRGRK